MAHTLDLLLQCLRPTYFTVSPAQAGTKARALYRTLASEYLVRLSPRSAKSDTWEYLSMNHSHSNTTLRWQLPEATKFCEA